VCCAVIRIAVWEAVVEGRDILTSGSAEAVVGWAFGHGDRSGLGDGSGGMWASRVGWSDFLVLFSSVRVGTDGLL